MSLFVGNISKNIDYKDVEKAFLYYGSCKINKRGSYAFIEYKHEADAEDAKDGLQGKNLGGLHINIEWSRRSGRFDPREANKRNFRGRRKKRSSSNSNESKKIRNKDRSRSRSQKKERSSPRYSEEKNQESEGEIARSSCSDSFDRRKNRKYREYKENSNDRQKNYRVLKNSE